MAKFKAGDRVRRKDGGAFSNGEHVATVERVHAGSFDAVWLKETEKYCYSHSVELVETNSVVVAIEEKIEELNREKAVITEEITKLADALAIVKTL